MGKWPKIRWIEQCMREGMQIESADIPIDEKVRLLDAISETGPQEDRDRILRQPEVDPPDGQDGRTRSEVPPQGGGYLRSPLHGEPGAATVPEMLPPPDPPKISSRTVPPPSGAMFSSNATPTCINPNRSPNGRASSRKPGNMACRRPRSALIHPSAPTGSGDMGRDYAMELFQKQWDLWNEAGIKVTGLQVSDPMGWNMPDQVQRFILAARERWPEIHNWGFHLHNTRGVALVSYYLILTTLGPEDTVTLDGSLGGLAGCPYCGNGRGATMVPTEDFFYMTQEMGIVDGELAGVDLKKLCDAVAVAEEVIGHPTWGHVSKSGPRPRGDELYAMDMPFIETLEQAQHFRKGPSVYQGCLSPWKEPIKSAQRDYAEWSYARFKTLKGK